MGDFYEEREQIGELLESVLREYLADACIPPVTDTCEEVFGRYAIGKFPSTREMRFFLEELAAFTPELANRLRTRVLGHFRTWTVVPQYVEKEFTVSAGGVSFSAKRVRGALTEATPAYRKWLREARAYDEQRKGALRRQLHYLRPLLPEAVAAARRKGLAVLAAFDRFVPPIWEGKPVVWVLAKGGKKEAPSLRPGGAQTHYPVTAKGEIEPAFCGKYWPTTAVPTPFFLLAHEFSWRSRNRLELVRPRSSKSPEVVLGPLCVEKLIRDADLKAQPQSGLLSRGRPRGQS